MNKSEFYIWIEELKIKTPKFVRQMERKSRPGSYKLTYSGDFFGDRHWGLAQTTFASRILYILNDLKEEERENNSKYISSFKKEDGSIYDELVKKISFPMRVYSFLRGRNFSESVLYKANNRAETRQAVASLVTMDNCNSYVYSRIPNSIDGINGYLKNLDWRFGAGSDINHLLFFTKYNNNVEDNEKKEILKLIEGYIEKYYQDDGLFYDKDLNISLNKKITFTMKIVMGLSIHSKEKKWISSNLLKTLINDIDPINACNNFNPILLLSKLNNKELDPSIIDKILLYAENWKNDYYFEELGGFSFYKGRSVRNYYGAKLSRGLNEPDLHGTAMFIWGVLLISEILNIREELNLKYPVL